MSSAGDGPISSLIRTLSFNRKPSRPVSSPGDGGVSSLLRTFSVNRRPSRPVSSPGDAGIPSLLRTFSLNRIPSRRNKSVRKPENSITQSRLNHVTHNIEVDDTRNVQQGPQQHQAQQDPEPILNVLVRKLSRRRTHLEASSRDQPPTTKEEEQDQRITLEELNNIRRQVQQQLAMLDKSKYALRSDFKEEAAAAATPANINKQHLPARDSSPPSDHQHPLRFSEYKRVPSQGADWEATLDLIQEAMYATYPPSIRKKIASERRIIRQRRDIMQVPRSLPHIVYPNVPHLSFEASLDHYRASNQKWLRR